MAWSEHCKIQFRETVKKYVDHGMSVRKAIEKLAGEIEVPYDTAKKWPYEKEKTVKNHVTKIGYGPESLPIEQQCEAAPLPLVIEPEKPTKSQFNRTTDSIEWAQWTWNPVTGCLHGCDYCYARDITHRFNDGDFRPKFHTARLEAPSNTPLPRDTGPGARNVFVCSMADLFGEWVPDEWVEQILEQVTNYPQWTFIFLTKNPLKLNRYEFPKNAWVGATVDVQSRTEEALDGLSMVRGASVKFISCEPLLEQIIWNRPIKSVIDWIIVGACSRTAKHPEMQPKWEWVEHIMNQARASNVMIYFKPNLTIRPKEYPV